MIEFAWPFSTGEWLAWITAVMTILIGLVVMLLPRAFMGFMGLATKGDTNNGVSEIRGPFGGTFVGFGLAAIILAQPLVYIALGFAFAFAVVGRLISFFADRTFNMHCVAATILEIAAAFFPLAYGLGIIP